LHNQHTHDSYTQHHHLHTNQPNMARTKVKTGYNDFLDGEKLRDNADVRSSLQDYGRDSEPPATRKDHKGRGRRGTKGGKAPKPQLTHFLCLPLVNDESRPQFQAGLQKLEQEVGQSGLVSLKAVRPVGTLHLTLGVMSLTDDKVDSATKYLQELDLQGLLQDVSKRVAAEKAAEGGIVAENFAAGLPDSQALSVELQGLHTFSKRKDMSHTSILYAEPKDREDRLSAFGTELRDKFMQGGFLIEDNRPLLLHATIINTVYAKPKGGWGKQKSGREKGLAQKGDGEPDMDELPLDEEGSTAGSSQEDEEAVAAPANGTALDGSDGHGPKAKGQRIFDAAKIVEQYKDVVWAKNVRIDRVQICKMGAKKILGDDDEVLDEQYEVVAEKVL
jgi:activating signal cointegrator complex subunit 1